MRMKSLSAALLAAGVTVVGTAGAFDLTPSWLRHDGKAQSTQVASAATAPSAVPALAVAAGQAPNYRAIVKQEGPAVVGVSVAGMHTASLEEQQEQQQQQGLPPG